MTNPPYGQQPPQYPQQPPQHQPPAQHVNLPGAQPWPQQQPQQPYAPQAWQQPQFPREAVTTRGDVSRPEQLAWAVAIIFTFGLAIPFYLARRRQLRRTTVTRYR